MSPPYLITGAVHPSAGESDDIARRADAYASSLAYMRTFDELTNMSNFLCEAQKFCESELRNANGCRIAQQFVISSHMKRDSIFPL